MENTHLSTANIQSLYIILLENTVLYILASPVSTPLSNQQTFAHIKLLFLVENLSY